jgi:hypothetical protein
MLVGAAVTKASRRRRGGFPSLRGPGTTAFSKECFWVTGRLVSFAFCLAAAVGNWLVQICFFRVSCVTNGVLVDKPGTRTFVSFFLGGACGGT